MLPLLYKSSASIPSSGSISFIGRLIKCESCAVTEQLNGEYELTAVFLPTDELVSEIMNQRFIMIKPNPSDQPQLFYIYECVIDRIGRINVKACHIKHCCYNNVISLTTLEEAPQNDTPLGHWNELSLAFNNNFSFSTDISATAPMAMGYTKVGTLGDFLEEMQTAFSADFKYDNFSVSLLSHRGARQNYVLRWNSNISSSNLTLSVAETYTHIVAYVTLKAIIDASGSQAQTEYEVQLCSNPVSITETTTPPDRQRNTTKVKMVDVSNKIGIKEIHPRIEGYSSIQSTLNTLAQNLRNTIVNGENVNFTVSLQAQLDEMAQLNLGDTVDVELKGGRTVEARITKTQFDCLAERWKSLELGQEKLMLSNYIAKRR
jgi:phage-related protein